MIYILNHPDMIGYDWMEAICASVGGGCPFHGAATSPQEPADLVRMGQNHGALSSFKLARLHVISCGLV